MGVAINHTVYFGKEVPQVFFYVISKPGTMGEPDGEVPERKGGGFRQLPVQFGAAHVAMHRIH